MAWRGQRVYYEEFWALRGVSLELYRGETIGLIGRNGAGKSTLLQLLCGTLLPTEGEFAVRGRIAALLGLGAGFNPEFTGRDNVFLNAAVLGLTEEQIRDRFDDIAGFADIGEFIDHPVKTYSSGMFARLAFSVAIHVDPEILIVDEILAVGDAAFQRKCLERFYQVRDGGCTILFVSHDPYQVKTLCKRALYLSHGEPVAYGPAEDVIDRYTYDMEQANARSRPVVQATVEKHAPEEFFRIKSVRLENSAGDEIQEVQSGQDIQLRFQYEAVAETFPEKISFVVNFYRHDDFYVCGTTTLMEGLSPFTAGPAGEVVVRFPKFCLLSGQYKWRVAINDHVGLVVHAEAKHVCPFRVVDRFRAVGLVDLPREWQVTALPSQNPGQVDLLAEVSG
jgi:lipopolysaccharide transport system ATP-binding protein